MNELIKRNRAVTATWNRFGGKPFDWRTSGTCIHMLRFHAAQMGHKLPVVPRFRSALTARKALIATGAESLAALLDANFVRLPLAMLRVGDVGLWPGTDGFDAVWIRADTFNYIGWHDKGPNCELIIPDRADAIGGWRL